MKHGKKYTDSRKLVDSTKLYEPAEALDLCAKTGKAKFDETVEIHVRLGVDSRHADQQVRGAVVLPNGTGKSVRVLCFARGDAAGQSYSHHGAHDSWRSPRSAIADSSPQGGDPARVARLR